MATVAHERGVLFYMENPMGSLWRRSYMLEWVKKKWVVRATVHYCAFRHFYHKPTHLWTHMTGWAPRNTTETVLCVYSRRDAHEEGEVGAQVQDLAGQQGCAWGQGQEGKKEHDACPPACGDAGGDEVGERLGRV